MTVKQKICDIFHPMIKDGGLLFIFLATLLVTISMFSTYVFRMSLWPWHKALLLGVPSAFAWVVVAWIITDKSVLRKPYPYIIIFTVMFFEKIYWALFYNLFPVTYRTSSGSIGDALALGNGFSAIPSVEWFNLLVNANNLFIVVEFIVALVLFVTLWSLVRPKDFEKLSFLKNKRMILLIIGAILMTVPLWILRAIAEIGGRELIRDLFTNIDWIDWYNLLFYGIPIAIALVIFAFVITNIKSKVKNILYLGILLSVLIPYVPIFDYMVWFRSSSTVTVFSYYFVFAAMYFVMFLSLLLLSKTKYIEQ